MICQFPVRQSINITIPESFFSVTALLVKPERNPVFDFPVVALEGMGIHCNEPVVALIPEANYFSFKFFHNNLRFRAYHKLYILELFFLRRFIHSFPLFAVFYHIIYVHLNFVLYLLIVSIVCKAGDMVLPAAFSADPYTTRQAGSFMKVKEKSWFKNSAARTKREKLLKKANYKKERSEY